MTPVKPARAQEPEAQSIAGRRFRSALRKSHIRYVVLNNAVFTPRQYTNVLRFLQGSLGAPQYVDPATRQVLWQIR